MAGGSSGPLPTPVPNRIAALFDAKRGQFYASIYDRVPSEEDTNGEPVGEDPGYHIPAPGGAIWRKIHPDTLMTAGEIVDGFAGSGLLGLLGDGLLYHREQFVHEGIAILPEQYWGPRGECLSARASESPGRPVCGSSGPDSVLLTRPSGHPQGKILNRRRLPLRALRR